MMNTPKFQKQKKTLSSKKKKLYEIITSNNTKISSVPPKQKTNKHCSSPSQIHVKTHKLGGPFKTYNFSTSIYQLSNEANHIYPPNMALTPHTN